MMSIKLDLPLILNYIVECIKKYHTLTKKEDKDRERSIVTIYTNQMFSFYIKKISVTKIFGK